jgi:hypothetical protein
MLLIIGTLPNLYSRFQRILLLPTQLALNSYENVSSLGPLHIGVLARGPLSLGGLRKSQ